MDGQFGQQPFNPYQNMPMGPTPGMGMPQGAMVPGLAQAMAPQPAGSLPLPSVPPNPAAAMPGQAPMARPAQPAQGVNPETVNAVLGMNAMGSQEAAIAHQMKMADALRGAAPGMMRSQSPINTPNWAGALAGATAGIRANRMDEAADTQLAGLGKRRENVYRQWFNEQFPQKGVLAAGPQGGEGE